MNTFRFKVLLSGEAAVGKTSILHRFVHNKFQGHYTSTIGLDFMSKVLNYNSDTCRLTIWDLAGQKRFSFMRKNFYGGANGALIIFDLTRAETFERVEDWYAEMIDIADKKVPFILIGNKTDLIPEVGRAIEPEMARSYAQERGCIYMESSAKTGESIEQAFFELTELMVKKKYEQVQ